MQTRTDSQEKEWGVRLNVSAWASAKDWPDWANPYQREKWREKGLIVWDQETQTVARLRGRHALAILAELRDSDEWEQQCYRYIVRSERQLRTRPAALE